MKALVIGGSGSIGKAIVTRLLDEGYEVIVQYNSANLTDLTNQFENGAVQFVQCDLLATSDYNKVFGFIHNLDCLIYSGGNALYGQIQDMQDEQIDDAYRLHVREFIRLSKYFVDQLRRSDNGRIIVISSIWGETGASLESVYSAMKSAQIGFIKAMSQELALTTVTVNAITPGIVRGRMSEVWSDEELQHILDELPQQRLIEPEEIAHTCAYLCHPFAKSVTGTVQKVNGGWYL
ncbi:elongation factor P 5-aminopentanone reductase [Staphylococcus kloosii]|uniref:3-oxoacyl-ACP reductase n=1 Tax=Staphylococcus kloosii TaxID=29384 RepID=A0A151A5P9_9STAP|nr:SDR family oxidoreductase [Staphylococcus kloosii]KYH14643.1 3-oxoacyl-ACP reductase [Staphylococcus kloosii]